MPKTNSQLVSSSVHLLIAFLLTLFIAFHSFYSFVLSFAGAQCQIALPLSHVYSRCLIPGLTDLTFSQIVPKMSPFVSLDFVVAPSFFGKKATLLSATSRYVQVYAFI